MKLFLTKRLDGLYAPHSDLDYEESKQFGAGDVVEVKKSNERTLWRHKRFFLALKLAFENMPEEMEELYPTQESLRKGLLLMAGHRDIVRTPDGSEHIVPGSMAFLNLGEDEFKQVYSAMVDVILKYFITEFDLQQQLIDLT